MLKVEKTNRINLSHSQFYFFMFKNNQDQNHLRLEIFCYLIINQRREKIFINILLIVIKQYIF